MRRRTSPAALTEKVRAGSGGGSGWRQSTVIGAVFDLRLSKSLSHSQRGSGCGFTSTCVLHKKFAGLNSSWPQRTCFFTDLFQTLDLVMSHHDVACGACDETAA
jgi:hypothetical protein